MNIGEFSKKTKLSVHTLRYYEKIGLLTSVSRKENGHRNYSSTDIEWINFITRLKETGMPLNDILEYTKLRALGEKTQGQRQELLTKHHAFLEQKIAREVEHLAALQKKIEYYRSCKKTLT